MTRGRTRTGYECAGLGGLQIERRDELLKKAGSERCETGVMMAASDIEGRRHSQWYSEIDRWRSQPKRSRY